MEHVHRLELKEIQWKGGTQTEDACLKGQEIFYASQEDKYAAERQFGKSYGKQQFWDPLPQLPQEKKRELHVIKQ